MINHARLIKNTGAYKIVAGDKAAGTLSHAYLLITADGKYLRDYMRMFARLIMCEHGGCGECRACKLIESERHTDVMFLPAEAGGKTVTEDIENLIEDSYVKPFEGDKKLYVLCGAEQMTPAAQNKLLKTLEEPPKGVHILLGATSEYPLLSTVKSRVKTLSIPPFTDEVLYGEMEKYFPDKERLKNAIANGDGTVGEAESLFGDEKLSQVTELAAEILTCMKSSGDVLEYSTKVLALKDMPKFLSVLEQMLRDMLVECEGGKVWNGASHGLFERAGDFTEGALIYALEKTAEAVKRTAFYVNETMLADWLLFAILEGKYKWQKS